MNKGSKKKEASTGHCGRGGALCNDCLLGSRSVVGCVFFSRFVTVVPLLLIFTIIVTMHVAANVVSIGHRGWGQDTKFASSFRNHIAQAQFTFPALPLLERFALTCH